MKRLVLVGRLNEYSQSLYSHLSTGYRVQFSTENLQSVRGVVENNNVDLILLSLVDMDEDDDALFYEIQRMNQEIPIFVIGTKEEIKKVRNSFFSSNITFVNRQSNETIMNHIKNHFGEKVDFIDNTKQENEDNERKVPLILVVDDSALTLRSMKRILEPKYKTVLVSNGSQAINQIDKKKPDLIILDYEMPVFNGEKIFKLLQTSDKTKNIPVIFLTGISDKNNTMTLLKLNPAGYFLKPPDKDKLLEAIDRILDGKAANS